MVAEEEVVFARAATVEEVETVPRPSTYQADTGEPLHSAEEATPTFQVAGAEDTLIALGYQIAH